MRKKPSVLVVDDETLIREMLGSSFPEAGYACETASTAEAALELVAGGSFDCVLVDIVLPGMSGLELTGRIKGLRPGTAVVVMTGLSGRFSYDTALEAGADDFIKKPFTVTEVLARLKVVMLRRDLHAWAVTDELTGVYNRKGFFTLGQHLLKVARRTGDELFLLYLDLDHLKAINDGYGHREGDLALIKAACIMKETFRESDIVARIGGDEFVVFPVGTTRRHQEVLVRRFEEAIARHNDGHKKPYRLSVSYGISAYDPRSPASLDDLLIEADKQMYRMKCR